MIVQIFVAQRQTKDALSQHLGHAMFHAAGISSVQKAPTESCHQIQPPVGFSQYQSARIRRDASTAELRHYLPVEVSSKLKPILVTLCHSRGRLLFWLKHLLLEVFRLDFDGFGYTIVEKSGLV